MMKMFHLQLTSCSSGISLCKLDCDPTSRTALYTFDSDYCLCRPFPLKTYPKHLPKLPNNFPAMFTQSLPNAYPYNSQQSTCLGQEKLHSIMSFEHIRDGTEAETDNTQPNSNKDMIENRKTCDGALDFKNGKQRA